MPFGTLIVIPEPNGATSSVGMSINNSDQVLVNSTFDDGSSRASLYDHKIGILTDVGDFGGSETVGVGITDQGAICGWSRDSSGVKHAFYYSEPTGLLQLPPLNPGDETEASNNTLETDPLIIYGVSRGAEETLVIWIRDPQTGLFDVRDLPVSCYWNGGTNCFFVGCNPGPPARGVGGPCAFFPEQLTVSGGVSRCGTEVRAYVQVISLNPMFICWYDLSLLAHLPFGVNFLGGGHCLNEGGNYYFDFDGTRADTGDSVHVKWRVPLTCPPPP